MLVIAVKIPASSSLQLLLPRKSKTFFNTIESYKNDKKRLGGIDLKLRNPCLFYCQITNYFSPLTH
jgi:hypothetical protein